MGSIIITLCILLLLAYLFDISSSITKIPSVILLLILGWMVKQGADFFKISIPDLTFILPLLGTVGLILIVLEGALELELNRTKYKLIGKSSFIAFVPMLLLSFGLAYAFQYYEGSSFKISLANAIPISVISSAIAIPSAKFLVAKDKEFITYESSLSDIIGVIFFNFITLNAYIGTQSVGDFFLQIIIMLIISFISTLTLAYFLDKIKHHVKFAPIILIIVLIYAISKIYHLPALIFILLFGIFLGNFDELNSYKFMQKFHPINFSKEINKFKELTTEFAFIIRSLFFLLFGYLIETSEILNSETIIWAIGITIGIFIIRALFLWIFKLPFNPLLFFAPRGLISILLFLTIPLNQTIGIANKSLVVQVIILTSLVMMFGLMKHDKEEERNNDNILVEH